LRNIFENILCMYLLDNLNVEERQFIIF